MRLGWALHCDSLSTRPDSVSAVACLPKKVEGPGGRQKASKRASTEPPSLQEPHFLVAKRLASEMPPCLQRITVVTMTPYSPQPESVSNPVEPQNSSQSLNCSATSDGGLRFGWRLRSTDRLRSAAPRAWYPGTTNMIRQKHSTVAGAPGEG